MPKTRRPVADYITFDQYKLMLKNEPNDELRLLYRYIWTFLLRISEATGQSDSDVERIKEYRQERKEFVERITLNKNKLRQYLKDGHIKAPKLGEHKWTVQLPGIRPCYIDAVSAEEAGYDSAHTLNIYRKMGKFETFPFNDEDLYDDTQAFIKERRIKPTDRLFNTSRRIVLNAMNKHGYTVGGQTRIHPHALRRGAGIWLRSTGKMTLEDLQALYSHEKLSQTLEYLGRDKTASFAKFALVQSRKKGKK